MEIRTIYYFEARFPNSTTSGQYPFLTYEEAQQVAEDYAAGGYEVSPIYSQQRYVDPITGTIGGIPAASTVPSSTNTTPSTVPGQLPTPGSTIPPVQTYPGFPTNNPGQVQQPGIPPVTIPAAEPVPVGVLLAGVLAFMWLWKH